MLHVFPFLSFRRHGLSGNGKLGYIVSEYLRFLCSTRGRLAPSTDRVRAFLSSRMPVSSGQLGVKTSKHFQRHHGRMFRKGPRLNC
jgi:hypothetical protein